MGYKVFCMVVFVIQMIITFVDISLAREHYRLNQRDATCADILAGISWGMTACWWFYQAYVTPVE